MENVGTLVVASGPVKPYRFLRRVTGQQAAIWSPACLEMPVAICYFRSQTPDREYAVEGEVITVLTRDGYCKVELASECKAGDRLYPATDGLASVKPDDSLLGYVPVSGLNNVSQLRYPWACRYLAIAEWDGKPGEVVPIQYFRWGR